MSLHQKQYVIIAILALGLILAMTGEVKDSGLLKWLGVAGIIGGFAADIRLWRCPHCGTWLGRYPGKHCKHCGAEIDYKKRNHHS